MSAQRGRTTPVDPTKQGPAPPAARLHQRAFGELQVFGEARILVIDDEPAMGELIRAALVNGGIVVDVVSDPTRVEAQARSQPYHVIILDWVIPGLISDETLKRMGEYQPAAGIIVVTAFPSLDSALNCLRAHIFDYLTKPFQVAELQRAVRRCLETKGLLRMTEEVLWEAVGLAIRSRRKAQKLTLAQLAQRANVSLGHLSQIELGKSTASLETLYRIALALKTRLAELFQEIETRVW